MGKHTIILISLLFFGCVCLALSLLLTFQSKQAQENTAIPVPSVQTALRPAILAIVPISATTAQVQITSYDSLPALIQLEIGYDPSVTADVTVTPGTVYAAPTIPLTITNPSIGRISYALSGLPEEQQIGKAAVVATLTFIPVSYATGEAMFELLPKTMIRGASGKTLPLTLQH